MTSDVDVEFSHKVLRYTESQLQSFWKQAIIGEHIFIQNAGDSIKVTSPSHFKKLEDFPADECVVCNYSTGTSGYPDIPATPTPKQRKQAVAARHVVLVLFGGVNGKKMPIAGDDASHWHCHNKKCVNPRHLIWENHDDNVTRDCCKRFRNFPNYKCPHTPTCVGCIPCLLQEEELPSGVVLFPLNKGERRARLDEKVPSRRDKKAKLDEGTTIVVTSASTNASTFTSGTTVEVLSSTDTFTAASSNAVSDSKSAEKSDDIRTLKDHNRSSPSKTKIFGSSKTGSKQLSLSSMFGFPDKK